MITIKYGFVSIETELTLSCLGCTMLLYTTMAGFPIDYSYVPDATVNSHSIPHGMNSFLRHGQ